MYLLYIIYYVLLYIIYYIIIYKYIYIYLVGKSPYSHKDLFKGVMTLLDTQLHWIWDELKDSASGQECEALSWKK